MPGWITGLLTSLLKIVSPYIKEWIEKFTRKRKIDREEDAKREELEKLKEHAQNWLRDNPGQPLPKRIEDKLRDWGDRNNSGL